LEFATIAHKPHATFVFITSSDTLAAFGDCKPGRILFCALPKSVLLIFEFLPGFPLVSTFSPQRIQTSG